MKPAPPAIHTVPGPNVNSHFNYAFANGFRVAEVAGFEMS